MPHQDSEPAMGKASREALDYGLDLSLLEANLQKTPEELIAMQSQAVNAIRKLQTALKKAKSD